MPTLPSQPLFFQFRFQFLKHPNIICLDSPYQSQCDFLIVGVGHFILRCQHRQPFLLVLHYSGAVRQLENLLGRAGLRCVVSLVGQDVLHGFPRLLKADFEQRHAASHSQNIIRFLGIPNNLQITQRLAKILKLLHKASLRLA